MEPKSRSGQLRAKRRADGRCVACGKPVAPDATGYRPARDPECQAIEIERLAQRRANRVCIRCGKPAQVLQDAATGEVVKVMSRCADCAEARRVNRV